MVATLAALESLARDQTAKRWARTAEFEGWGTPTVVHDCPSHGILGADEDSGSLTLDYVEVYRCGSGYSHHPIYIATDEQTHPHSVFRMQHCYVHDGLGGNNVKSRA